MGLKTLNTYDLSYHDALSKKTQEFYEESTFFAPFYKKFIVRYVIDDHLMLILEKRKWKNKKRKVLKKSSCDSILSRKEKFSEFDDH